jgi:hypothetical protein
MRHFFFAVLLAVSCVYAQDSVRYSNSTSFAENFAAMQMRCQLFESAGQTVPFNTCGMTTATGGTLAQDTGIETNRIWLKLTTGAVSGNAAHAGLISNFSGRMGTRTYIRWRTGSSIDLVRIWVGLVSFNMQTTSGGSGSGANGAAFRFATDVSDTTFKACTGANGGAYSCTDTGIVPATNTIYTMEVDCSGIATTGCAFYINGALVATRTTILPNTVQNCGPAVSITTLTAAAREAYFSIANIQAQP